MDIKLMLTIITTCITDLLIIAIFGFLAYKFNNIWIMLIALLFIKGFQYSSNNKEDKHDE